MLIWSRHNRSGPAVAQSPHNNPPRPRLSPLLPPPAAHPAQSPAPRSAAPSSTPPPVSLRPAGRFRPPGGGVRGEGQGSPARRQTGQPPPRANKIAAEARPTLGLPAQGALWGAGGGAREGAGLFALSGRKKRGQREKGPARPEAQEFGERPPFFRGVCGGRLGPSRSRALFSYRGGLAAGLQGFSAGVWLVSRACPRWSRATPGFSGPAGQSSRLGHRCLDSAVFVPGSELGLDSLERPRVPS